MEKKLIKMFPKNVKVKDVCKKSSRSVLLILSLNFPEFTEKESNMVRD